MFTWTGWEEFLRLIEAAKQELGDPAVTWYRGHGSFNWNLLPQLHREGNVQKEREVFYEFERVGSRLFKDEKTDWDVLFDMQHYGLPTRLLDWSETPGIAIAFALLSATDQGDAAVWLLDPLALNARSNIPEVKRLPGDRDFDFRSIYWENRPFAIQPPVAIYPRFRSDRLFAQRGTFTVHGSDSRPLEMQHPDLVRRVKLDGSLRDGARRFLDYANLDELTLYPDIVGMAQYIRRKVVPRPTPPRATDER